MFITNTKNVNYHLHYKVNGQVKRATIAPNATVEFPTITSINEVVFDTVERRQRDINARLGRNIDSGVDYRLTPGLTGSTL